MGAKTLKRSRRGQRDAEEGRREGDSPCRIFLLKSIASVSIGGLPPLGLIAALVFPPLFPPIFLALNADLSACRTVSVCASRS